MDTDGGGWTMFGRGRGGNTGCWPTNGDCNYLTLGSDKMAWDSGSTAKMSDSWTNLIKYTRIRMSGTGIIKTNIYWKGKDDGGCRYNHGSDASGACNCASNNVNMGSRRCGSNYGNHDG